jgi:exopolysaccharide biosynthesis polyprenyl glycosylphosphotransferase
MLKQNWQAISRIERFFDNLIILFAFWLTYHFRGALGGGTPILLGPLTSIGGIEDYLIILGIALPIFNASLHVMGAYQSMRFSSFWSLIKSIGFSCSVVFVSVAAVLFALKLDLSRSFIGIFCALSFALLLFERISVLALLRYFRIKGRNFRNMLIVGINEQGQKIFSEIKSQPELGIRIVGYVNLNNSNETDNALPLRIVANADTFESALKKHAIDDVLFTDVVENFHLVRELAELAVEEGVRVSLAADLFSLGILNSQMTYFGSVPLIHYQPTPAKPVALITKRLIDILISSIALVLLSPIFLLVAIAIKIETPGPVFFKQRRVGLNGRKFTLLKFRSMVNHAEEALEELKSQNEMNGPVFKMTNDPRITKFGKFLRKFSIDEFPQLINVLAGDMSIVGPRPPLPEEVNLYKRQQRRRLSMRPGLTCTWQVSGRNNIQDFNRWAKMDLEYIDNWSLLTDLKLIAKTIPVVLIGKGAR